MPRNVKIGIIVSVLILLTIIGFSYWINSPAYKERNFVKKIERNITPEDRKVFEDRVVQYKNMLGNAKDDAEKYNLYLAIGQTEHALGNLQEAKEGYLEAIKIKSDQYDVHVNYFLTQVDMRDYAGAEESIKKAMEFREGNADLWKKYITFKIDRLNVSNDEIRNLYDQAVDDISRNSDALNYTDILTPYASWLEKIGDIPGAIEKWKKAIEINPERTTIYQAEIDRLQKLIE